MHYDQSWMGHGIVGGLEAGLISLLAALLSFLLLHRLGRRHGWNQGAPIGWSFLSAMVLTASGDLWDLFYFNYAKLQSLQLLRAELALVHDPENLGLRVLCELLGVAMGIGLGWAACRGSWPGRFTGGR